MSFLYAGNYNNNIYIFSDTKVSFSSTEEQEMFYSIVLKKSQEKLEKLKICGTIKNVIINNNICIGFAGQLKDFNELLKFVESKKIKDINIIKNKANEINIKSFGATDFIIAYTDKSIKELYLIKNGKVEEKDSCWIGSLKTADIFEKQKTYLEIKYKYNNEYKKVNDNIELLPFDSKSIDLQAFRYAITNTTDVTVGGFIVECLENRGKFFYPEQVNSSVERKQILKNNESVILYDNAEKGGYSYHFFETKDFVSLYIDQMSRGIRYSPCLEDENYNYLRIPVYYNLSKCDFIKKFDIRPTIWYK